MIPYTEAHSELFQTSKMKRFAIIINVFHLRCLTALWIRICYIAGKLCLSQSGTSGCQKSTIKINRCFVPLCQTSWSKESSITIALPFCHVLREKTVLIIRISFICTLKNKMKAGPKISNFTVTNGSFVINRFREPILKTGSAIIKVKISSNPQYSQANCFLRRLLRGSLCLPIAFYLMHFQSEW